MDTRSRAGERSRPAPGTRTERFVERDGVASASRSMATVSDGPLDADLVDRSLAVLEDAGPLPLAALRVITFDGRGTAMSGRTARRLTARTSSQPTRSRSWTPPIPEAAWSRCPAAPSGRLTRADHPDRVERIVAIGAAVGARANHPELDSPFDDESRPRNWRNTTGTTGTTTTRLPRFFFSQCSTSRTRPNRSRTHWLGADTTPRRSSTHPRMAPRRRRAVPGALARVRARRS